MNNPVQDFEGILTRLLEHGVEFVIIGGFCATIHGVSLVTQDIDICIRLSPENLRRIESAFKDVRPFHRLTANKLPLELTDDQCESLKNLYIKTDIGTLDCLGDVKGVGDYEEALKHSLVFELSYGRFRILDIDALIAAKNAVGRDRDIAAVKQLRAIKERQQPKTDA